MEDSGLNIRSDHFEGMVKIVRIPKFLDSHISVGDGKYKRCIVNPVLHVRCIFDNESLLTTLTICNKPSQFGCISNWIERFKGRLTKCSNF